MQVDALDLRLRPRSMAEAADLGVLLVRRHLRSVWRVWLPVFSLFALFALATIELGAWLPVLLVFWSKPWLDRTLLFALSRAVFGQETHLADLWRERRTVWWSELPATLTLRRLSPWRAFTAPVGQLEGQRGKARRLRRRVLLKGRRGAALGMHAVFANVETVFSIGVLALVLWFAPEGTQRHVVDWLREAEGLGSALPAALLYMAVVAVLEPFYVAAGFAMYLNRRVELEAWDIEQEFRRAFA
jgi:hypothetical protein